MSIASAARSRVKLPRPDQFADMHEFTIGPGDTVVDVGCGDGFSCRYAGAQGAAVIGLDVEPTLIAQADEAMRDIPARSWRGIVSDCDPIPLPDATASVILCTEVLEHVPDPSRLVAELVRIGRPGARYLISVPAPVSEGLMRHFVPAWYWKPPFHVRVFGQGELANLLRRAGLDVERQSGFGFYYTMRWLFWATLHVGPYDPVDDTATIQCWEAAYKDVFHSREAAHLIPLLDRALPKSQVVYATKPARSTFFRLPKLRNGRAWKQRVKAGTVSLAGLEFSWTLRRHRPVG